MIELDLAQRVHGGGHAGTWRATATLLHAERLLEERLQHERERDERERRSYQQRRH
jgi:hypothetical protein